VPVTYADVWEFWTRHDSLAAEVDFVTVHILPFWEDEPVDIELALEHVADTRRHVGEHFAGKQILIGETGWPSAGRQREESKPSRVNQARYIREFVHRAHAEGWDYNLIEAIDQPWKRRLEGTVGGFWGMLDASTACNPSSRSPVRSPNATSVTGPLGGAAGRRPARLPAVAATGRRTGCLRVSAITATGALGGLVAVLHWEHAHLAYRDALEWSLLGGVAALAALLPLTLARWYGEPDPRHRQRRPHRCRAHRAPALQGRRAGHAARPAAVRGGGGRAAAVGRSALSRLSHPALPRPRGGARRRRLVAQRHHAQPRRTLALVILLGVVARWSSEPANAQAIAWLLTGLALALPVLLVRRAPARAARVRRRPRPGRSCTAPARPPRTASPPRPGRGLPRTKASTPAARLTQPMRWSRSYARSACLNRQASAGASATVQSRGSSPASSTPWRSQSASAGTTAPGERADERRHIWAN
jgi:hypothetical protein